MQDVLQVLEYLVMGIWIAVVLYGSYKVNNPSKNKKKTTAYQSKQEAQNSHKNEKTDIAEEERKLKAWLEGVFLPETKVKQPEPVVDEVVEDDAWGKRVNFFEESEADENYLSVSQSNYNLTKSTNRQFGNFGRTQMAQAVIMSEILAKPVSLRSKSKNRYNRKSLFSS